MSGANEPDFFGKDLLSEALGQSGLNLDEYLGNAPGNVLSQAILDVGDVRPDDFDFVDNFNLSRDFISETPFIALTTSTDSRVTSSYVSTQEKLQVSEVQQTFLGQRPTLPNVASSGTFFQTPRELPLRCQNQQFVSKTSTTLDFQRLHSSTSPILLNLLNNGSNAPVSNSSDAAKKELTKK